MAEKRGVDDSTGVSPSGSPARSTPDSQAQPESRTPNDQWWRPIVAVGVVAGDWSARAIARYGNVSMDQAMAAHDAAMAAGVIDDDGIDSAEASSLMADLSPDHVADIHATVARRLIAEGPSRLLDAIEHARAAGHLVPMDELVDLTDHAGNTSLSISDYNAAQQLLEVADEFGFADPPTVRARRLCQLADAFDGLGRVTEARAAAARAFDLAELAADPALATEAAVRYALPADWYAGDSRAASLLQRAAALGPDTDDAVAITAARAIVEMRIPVSTELDQQLAWVTRASVAQPLAEQALNQSAASPPAVRVLALLAWRTTHRSPQHLDLRREVSSQALDLTQQLRLPSRQVEAAVMLAVDALESADRPRFDEALSVARWVAERDGNPRLVWHALTLAAGAAHLDGDTDEAANLRAKAREVGESVQVPGWLGADLMLFGEELLTRGDTSDIAATLAHIDDDNPTLVAPLGRMMVAHGHALLGNADAAERNLRRSLRGLDDEASHLLVATRGAQVAILLNLHDVIADLIEVLTPWAGHVAVDSNAWWCDGPVSLALAELHHAIGSSSRAQQLLGPAEAVALTMGDVRAINRARTLQTTVVDHGTSPATDVQLTDREWQVLKLVAQGQTNPEIAATLAYSPSTIRNDLTAVYRKLGVRGRSEAASRANDLGIA